MADISEEEVIEENEVDEAVVAEEVDPQRSGPGMMTVVKAVVVLAVIVMVEVLAASMFAPSAHETEKIGRQLVAATVGQSAQFSGNEGEANSYASKGADLTVREVELGIYNVTRYNATSNKTLAIDFELFGTVLADDEAEFRGLFEQTKVRIREQVLMTLHGAETSDLTDAGLGLIKRQILEKVNRTIGQPLVREVLFSKFSFVER